eukprot:TRINITY_DN455_c0_g1_i5.p1 TRINITY_DN455_c0_g1~~TRINITY_DN455_c0_g1_i5.p1  ORF type:complete len:174 (+),score=28.32 TRINITY_DN455_c0_g1_i5:199-720(+)
MGAYVSSLGLTAAGILYPAYRSFKALERPGAEDDAMWLTYWIVFAFFTLFECIADRFIFWIPFYYELKFLFVMWLQLPQTQGAKHLYEDKIRPFLSEREESIDDHLNNLTTNAKTAAVTYAQKGVRHVVKHAPGVVSKLTEAVVSATASEGAGADNTRKIEGSHDNKNKAKTR